ncbi:MAG: LysR-family transcriptional regulator [Ilumatobacteraceae bacterium]|nr:LysR-family transcriptional regulator [Ilumatobacteraceae bacterium]
MAVTPGLDDLDALALLVSVVELGSLSQAGARHGVSQPAASMRIARLESRLGLLLVERSTTGCTPTPAGAAMVEWSRDILAHAERMGRAVQSLKDSTAGMSMAASLTIAEQLLPGWLAVVHARHPQTRIKVSVANSAAVIDMVRNGHVGLGFVETPEAIHGLHTRVVAHDRLVVVVSPDHPWRRRRSMLLPRHLAETPLVLREEGSGTRVTLERALARVGLRMVEPVLELASTAAVRNAVAAGVAPTVMSELAVSDDVATGRLATVAVDGLDLARPLTALWRGAAPAVLSLLEQAAAATSA